MKALHRMERFLDEHMIPFDLVAHPHSQTSAETARAAGCPLIGSPRACCSTAWIARWWR
jgi:hypothetical protein